MGKTADLTVVQKQSLTPFTGGKTQTFITKKLFKSAYPSMLTESEWKEKLWNEKEHNQPSELHKEWTEAGVKAIQEHHTQTCRGILATVVVRDVLPGQRRRRTGLCQGSKVLCS